MKASGSIAILTLLGTACSVPPTLPEPFHPAIAQRLPRTESKPVPRGALPADRIAVVPQGTFGPYVGDRPEGMLAAWAAQLDDKRHWLTAPIREAGTPEVDPKIIADAGNEVDLVALRPTGGTSRGFMLLSSSREFAGERVDAIALGLRGELTGGPTPLAQSLPGVVWVDAVPTALGAIAMWAVPREDRADLFGVEVSSSGEVRDQPTELVADARAWQVAPASGGAAIAVLTAGKARDSAGPLRIAFVDSEGHLDRKSVLVSDGATVEPDVDLAAIGDKLVLAWSDRRYGEPRLFSAVATTAGTLEKPATPLGRPFGAQAVLRIVPPEAPSGPAFLVWENLIEHGGGSRTVRLARLAADGTLGGSSAIVHIAGADGVPEFAATPEGVAALTLAPACERGATCVGARAVPTFVSFDGALDVTTSGPVRLAPREGEDADLAWGLTCHRTDCVALAAGSGSPAPVFAVRLAGVKPDWQPAGERVRSEPPPRATWMDGVARSDSLAELAAARTGNSTFLSWVTYFDPATPFVRSKTPAPDGKYEPPRAVVRVLNLPDERAPIEPTVISYRGHSPGGVAVSPGDPAVGDAVVAWTGIDDKRSQVFLTRVGADGKKAAQKMLTHGKNGVSDVALASAPDGWIVAWIDERAGASEIHVEKVDRALRPIVPEQRIGATAGNATGVQLLMRGDHVFVVWSDARGATPGVADIFAARLTAKDLTQVGPERAIAETPAHSRSPAVAPFEEGAVVAWVEDSPSGGEELPSTVMVARLDSGAEPVSGSVAQVTLTGSAEGVGLTCDQDDCHIVATVAGGGSGSLEAFDWSPGSTLTPRRLVNLEKAPEGAVSPVIIGDEAFYADEHRAGDALIRRIGIAWK